MIAYSVVILCIVGLLLSISPLMTIGVALVIGGMYALIYLLVRGVLAREGQGAPSFKYTHRVRREVST